jgi:ubiquinone/menaquinone biosynthesis C-methylase UbiE
MRKQADGWKKYWDTRSQEGVSRHEVDRGRGLQDKEMEEIVERELLSFIDPNENECIFDAGCGTGINLNRLHSRVHGIVGMDYIQGMINHAKKRVDEEGLANVRLLRGDVAAVGLKDNLFDKIICMSVTQYLSDEDCESALKEMVRVGKDGAIVIMHIKNISSLYLSTLYIAKRVKNILKKDVEIDYYRSYKWYEKRLSSLGAVILDYNSYNIFLIDFLPKKFLFWLERFERKNYKSRFLRKYGADYFIKAQLLKKT